jgi:hypothetical protein
MIIQSTASGIVKPTAIRKPNSGCNHSDECLRG